MKSKSVVSSILLGVAMMAQPISAAETAQARAFCLSLQFVEARESGGLYSLNLSTLAVGVNWELALDFFTPQYTHSSWLVVKDLLFEEYSDGWIELDIPEFVDANGNGFNDFFEVGQPVSGSSSGVFAAAAWGSGTVQAFWGRDAGSHLGSCTLQFKVNQFQTYTFTHPFMLREYTGPVSFEPGASKVKGQVELSQTGEPEKKMGGSVEFVKTSTNKYNAVVLQPGTWTNSDSLTLAFDDDLFTRDAEYPTNYSGYLDFQDGELGTPEQDYFTWVLAIDDPNDADKDTIPDFSDDPQGSSLPRRPLLTLALTTTSLELKIAGDVGHVHEVLEAGSPNAATWQTNQTLTLATDPQVIALPKPGGETKFFQVRAW